MAGGDITKRELIMGMNGELFYSWTVKKIAEVATKLSYDWAVIKK